MGSFVESSSGDTAFSVVYRMAAYASLFVFPLSVSTSFVLQASPASWGYISPPKSQQPTTVTVLLVVVVVLPHKEEEQEQQR
jgi:hypothetical protein